MSVFTTLVESRRSIRKFRENPPPRELLLEMIRCTSFAPSPSNSRPVRYIAVNSPDIRGEILTRLDAGRAELLDQIDEAGLSKRLKNRINVYFRYSEFMLNAPWLLAAGTAPVKTFAGHLREQGLQVNEKSGNDVDIALGASLQTLMLKGAELGIGTCVLTAPMTFLESLSDIRGFETVNLKCFIAAGYPDETPGYIERSTPDDIFQEL
jgi:nitroreductase